MTKSKLLIVCLISLFLTSAEKGLSQQKGAASQPKKPSEFAFAWLTLRQWTRATPLSGDRVSIDRWTFSPDSIALHATTEGTPACLIDIGHPACVLRHQREAWFRWNAYIVEKQFEVCLSATTAPEPEFGQPVPRPVTPLPGESGCHRVGFWNSSVLPEAAASIRFDSNGREYRAQVPVPSVDCDGEAFPAAVAELVARCMSRPDGLDVKQRVPVTIFPSREKALAERPVRDSFEARLWKESRERFAARGEPPSCWVGCPTTLAEVLAMRQPDSLRALIRGKWQDTTTGSIALTLYLPNKTVGLTSSNVREEASALHWYVLPWSRSPNGFLFCMVEQQVNGYRTPADTVAVVPPRADALVRCYVGRVLHEENGGGQLMLGNSHEWPILTRVR